MNGNNGNGYRNGKTPEQKPWKTPTNKRKKKGGTKRTVLYVALALVALIIIAAGVAALWANHYMDKEPEQKADSAKLPISSDMFEFDGELPELENPVGRKSGFYNILVIGRDKVALNTDVIICASFDIKNNKASTVQIPRDSYVKDKNGNTSKINAVFARGYSAARQELNSLKRNGNGKTDEKLTKLCENSSLDIELSDLKGFIGGSIKQESLCTRFGIELLQDTISRTFGIYFDYYAVVSTDAFVKIVDAVGGVDVYVQDNMDYEDPEQNLYIHIKKGQQHLDGKAAEGFVRFRYGYAQADLARLDAQKIFLTAFFKKLTSFSSITKVDNILKAVYDSVETDMSLENALGFVKPAMGVDLSSITMLNMQGTPYRNGMYYSLNKAENLKIVNEYFNIFTHALSESAVSVEELVQSTASTDGIPGHTMEQIDGNELELGFIHRNPQGSSNSNSNSGSNTSSNKNPTTDVPAISVTPDDGSDNADSDKNENENNGATDADTSTDTDNNSENPSDGEVSVEIPDIPSDVEISDIPTDTPDESNGTAVTEPTHDESGNGTGESQGAESNGSVGADKETNTPSASGEADTSLAPPPPAGN